MTCHPHWLHDAKSLPWFVFQAMMGLAVHKMDVVRKSVVYVGTLSNDHFNPLGTGFLTYFEVDKEIFPVVVTARHVIAPVQESQSNALGVRMNLQGNGGARFIQLPRAKWRDHPNAESDLSFCNFKPDASAFDYLLMTVEESTLSKAREAYPPTLGGEVIISGLYTSHYGAIKNIPVIRTGHIAALPEEPVASRAGYTEGYLVETRSIGGLSGSPVYVKRPDIVIEDEKVKFFSGDMIYPLGILLGHHAVETREDEIPVPRVQGTKGAPLERIEERNTGFGVVVPIERLTEVFYSDENIALARESIEMKKEKSGFREDAASVPLTEEQIAERRDAGLAKALSTPPAPQKK